MFRGSKFFKKSSFKEWRSLEKPIGKQEDAAYWDLSAE